MRYWTADLHFGHVNIIKYCARPFATVEEMNAQVIERINAVVRPDDELWVLGDVAMGTVAVSLENVQQLNGRKLLVPGNHDRCWEGDGERAAQWVSRYKDAGFAEVIQGPIDVQLGEVTVQASHFPYEGDSHDEDRFSLSRPVDRGGFVLHGHVHTKWRKSGRQVNVGIDAWNGRPVADSEIVMLIQSPDEDVAPIEWRPPESRTAAP